MYIEEVLKLYDFVSNGVEGAYKREVDDDEVIRVCVMDMSTNPVGECFLEHYGDVYRFDSFELSAYLKEVLCEDLPVYTNEEVEIYE